MKKTVASLAVVFLILSGTAFAKGGRDNLPDNDGPTPVLQSRPLAKVHLAEVIVRTRTSVQSMDTLYLILNLKIQTYAVRRILVTVIRTDQAGMEMKKQDVPIDVAVPRTAAPLMQYFDWDYRSGSLRFHCTLRPILFSTASSALSTGALGRTSGAAA